MITIILVEKSSKDREQIIAHLRAHADFEVVGTGCDGYAALLMAKRIKPDIAILNINLNFFNMEVSRLLKSNSPGTAVVLFGSRREKQMMNYCAGGHASAYLLKEEDFDDLAAIIRKVKAGAIYVNPQIGIWAVRFLAEVLRENRRSRVHQDDLSKYSRNEIQMFKLIGQGFTDKEMAGKMRLKSGTMRNYVSKFMKKFGFKNRAQMIRYAVTHGLAG